MVERKTSTTVSLSPCLSQLSTTGQDKNLDSVASRVTLLKTGARTLSNTPVLQPRPEHPNLLLNNPLKRYSSPPGGQSLSLLLSPGSSPNKPIRSLSNRPPSKTGPSKAKPHPVSKLSSRYQPQQHPGLRPKPLNPRHPNSSPSKPTHPLNRASHKKLELKVDQYSP